MSFVRSSIHPSVHTHTHTLFKDNAPLILHLRFLACAGVSDDAGTKRAMGRRTFPLRDSHLCMYRVLMQWGGVMQCCAYNTYKTSQQVCARRCFLFVPTRVHRYDGSQSISCADRHACIAKQKRTRRACGRRKRSSAACRASFPPYVVGRGE